MSSESNRRARMVFFASMKEAMQQAEGIGEEYLALMADIEREARERQASFRLENPGMSEVVCASCGKRVKGQDSWGDGEVGDRSLPSFCSAACYYAGAKRREYRVSWEIDVDGETPREAARMAFKVQSDGTSAAVFDVRELSPEGELGPWRIREH